ncbi:hypothetical protein BLNAU_22424 [Blattamonas nauphoetae]|uniref:Uncharacterized protein n=1 Tax=Blattamonas nauphoetae TaxID=2049346 RepID=A0ABQ9WTL2_9EUKA|nr:hypothetical protein BLNAU_22424 [Blattamonas nauphoetae]
MSDSKSKSEGKDLQPHVMASSPLTESNPLQSGSRETPIPQEGNNPSFHLSRQVSADRIHSTMTFSNVPSSPTQLPANTPATAVTPPSDGKQSPHDLLDSYRSSTTNPFNLSLAGLSADPSLPRDSSSLNTNQNHFHLTPYFPNPSLEQTYAHMTSYPLSLEQIQPNDYYHGEMVHLPVSSPLVSSDTDQAVGEVAQLTLQPPGMGLTPADQFKQMELNETTHQNSETKNGPNFDESDAQYHSPTHTQEQFKDPRLYQPLYHPQTDRAGEIHHDGIQELGLNAFSNSGPVEGREHLPHLGTDPIPGSGIVHSAPQRDDANQDVIDHPRSTSQLDSTAAQHLQFNLGASPFLPRQPSSPPLSTSSPTLERPKSPSNDDFQNISFNLQAKPFTFGATAKNTPPNLDLSAAAVDAVPFIPKHSPHHNSASTPFPTTSSPYSMPSIAHHAHFPPTAAQLAQSYTFAKTHSAPQQYAPYQQGAVYPSYPQYPPQNYPYNPPSTVSYPPKPAPPIFATVPVGQPPTMNAQPRYPLNMSQQMMGPYQSPTRMHSNSMGDLQRMISSPHTISQTRSVGVDRCDVPYAQPVQSAQWMQVGPQLVGMYPQQPRPSFYPQSPHVAQAGSFSYPASSTPQDSMPSLLSLLQSSQQQTSGNQQLSPQNQQERQVSSGQRTVTIPLEIVNRIMSESDDQQNDEGSPSPIDGMEANRDNIQRTDENIPQQPSNRQTTAKQPYSPAFHASASTPQKDRQGQPYHFSQMLTHNQIAQPQTFVSLSTQLQHSGQQFQRQTRAGSQSLAETRTTLSTGTSSSFSSPSRHSPASLSSVPVTRPAGTLLLIHSPRSKPSPQTHSQYLPRPGSPLETLVDPGEDQSWRENHIIHHGGLTVEDMQMRRRNWLLFLHYREYDRRVKLNLMEPLHRKIERMPVEDDVGDCTLDTDLPPNSASPRPIHPMANFSQGLPLQPGQRLQRPIVQAPQPNQNVQSMGRPVLTNNQNLGIGRGR